MTSEGSILWIARSSKGIEYCTLRSGASGAVLAGTCLRTDEDAALSARYTVTTDSGWRTREVEIHQTGRGSKRSLSLCRDEKGWSLSGELITGFEHCLDVDLEFSPATNTLPIRRLGLKVGERAEVAALWVRWPRLSIEALAQSYERLSKDRYLYRSGSFSAELAVASDGLVLGYADLWDAVRYTANAQLGPLDRAT